MCWLDFMQQRLGFVLWKISNTYKNRIEHWASAQPSAGLNRYEHVASLISPLLPLTTHHPPGDVWHRSQMSFGFTQGALWGRLLCWAVVSGSRSAVPWEHAQDVQWDAGVQSKPHRSLAATEEKLRFRHLCCDVETLPRVTLRINVADICKASPSVLQLVDTWQSDISPLLSSSCSFSLGLTSLTSVHPSLWCSDLAIFTPYSGFPVASSYCRWGFKLPYSWAMLDEAGN